MGEIITSRLHMMHIQMPYRNILMMMEDKITSAIEAKEAEEGFYRGQRDTFYNPRNHYRDNYHYRYSNLQKSKKFQRS